MDHNRKRLERSLGGRPRIGVIRDRGSSGIFEVHCKEAANKDSMTEIDEKIYAWKTDLSTTPRLNVDVRPSSKFVDVIQILRNRFSCTREPPIGRVIIVFSAQTYSNPIVVFRVFTEII